MMQIEVNTTTATLIPPRESLTPGSVNAVQLQFNFSEEWNGLTKTCVFSNEIETIPAEIQNDVASVPEEILDEVYRWISVGVSGEDTEGTVIIPTIWCRIGQCLPGVSGRFVTIDMLQAYWSKQEVMFELDGDGTKFFGNDGLYHSVAQGGGDVTHEELDAALALKADKTEVEALAGNLDDKADKSEIITVTTGDGTKFLSDDGIYKIIQGGGDVTQQDLADAIAPLATKAELADAVEPLATKTELTNATAGFATTAAMNAALALKADKSELNSYARQYDVNQALATKADKTELANYATKSEIITVTDGDGTQFLANDGTYKRVQTDLSSYLTKTEAEQTYATQTEVAEKADKSEIITVTTGTGTLFLSDDGTYKPAAGDPPDLSAYLTKTEASTTYETQAHAAETYATKAEIPDVSGFETTAHASTTYATETELTEGLATKADSADIADMLTKTEAGTTYATQTALTEGLAGKVDTATLADYETTAHAEATYATKAEIPDVSGFETVAHAEATYATKTELADKADASAVDSALALKADKTELSSYETTEHASTTYATKTELTEGLAGKVDTADIADMLTKTEAEGTYADKASVYTLENTVEAQGTRITNLETNKADKTEIITITNGTGTLFLADDGTYKPAAGDPPDLSAYLTKTEAGTTYATQTALTEGLAAKVDTATLADYETTAHASATYATKAELPDVSDMLTKTEAGTTYATKTELADKADSATVTALSGVVTGHTAEITALQTTKADKSEIPDVSGFETTAHAEATYATKTELPDVSDMLTKTEAGTTYATKAELPDTSDMLTKTEAASTYATRVELGDYETSAHAEATYATKTELPDVSDMLTKTEAGTTYATKAELPDTSDMLTKTEAASTYATQAELGDYETSSHASATYATKSELPDVSDMLTQTAAAATYETSVHAAETYLPVSKQTEVTYGYGNNTVAYTVYQPVVSGGYKRMNIDFTHTDKNTNLQIYGAEGDIAGVAAWLGVRAVTWDEFTDFTTTASPIKSISYGGIAVTPDANGEVALSKSEITVAINPTSPPSKTYRLTAADGNTFTLLLANDATLARVGFSVGGETANVELATQTWVQQYIVSLDGTNMTF